jgi:hypothetical protein
MAAPVVTSRVIEDNELFHVVRLTGNFTDTQESGVQKVDASALSFAGAAPRPAIRKAKFGVTEPGSVRLLFDADTDVLAVELSGNGKKVFSGGLSNNGGAGVTGDILLTTTGIPSGGSYDLTLTLDKRNGYSPAPQVTAIAFTDEESGAYVTDEVIEITLTFNQPVFIDPQNPPTITIDGNGATTFVAQYVSGDGSNQLVFRYTVLEGDNAEATEFDVATDALAGTFRGTVAGQLVATDPAIPDSNTAAFTVNPA